MSAVMRVLSALIAVLALCGTRAIDMAGFDQGPPTALSFADVAEKSCLATFRQVGGSTPDNRYIPEVMSGGVCAADFDGDNWTDVLLVNGGSFESAAGKKSPPAHGLYRNTGAGAFTNVTAGAGIRNAGWGMGCAVADYDNDGDPDLYITNFLSPNQLWRNDGGWRFSDVSAQSGAAGPAGRWNTGATFGDYDLDGRLDLFVAGYVHMDPDALPEPADKPDCRHRGLVVNCGPRGLPGEGDLLFHNEGKGTFREVGGVIDPKKFYGLGAAFLPLGTDGTVVLYVANDSTPNALYTFDGKKIRDIALEAGAALSEQGHEQAGMGIGWGDYDADGRIDLYVTNFVDDYNTLYRSLGKDLFGDLTRRAGLAQPTWLYMGWGTARADFDRDGRDDIVVVNGHVYPQVDTLNLPSKWRMPAQVFQNTGNGRFAELPRGALPGEAVGRGLALADFWNDGTVGIVVNNLDGPPALYRPVAAQNHYIELVLEGSRIRDATGTRVDLRWDGGRTTRLVVSGGSYLSSHDRRIHAGVGAASTVDLDVVWPGGARQTLRGLQTNRLHRIREGASPEPR
jgi:enediyne biosynthesis protein E4